MKKLIIIISILFSSFSFAGEFEGIWRSKLEDKIIYVEIKDNNIYYLQRNIQPYFKDLKAKGIIFKENNEFFVKITHRFSVFEWREVKAQEIYSLKFDKNKLIFNNGNLIKSNIKTIFNDEKKYRIPKIVKK